MNTAPQYSLRWNNYINHVTDAFSVLRSENDLVDVTLCCEGGKIKAHRMLLSACSTYFKQIFKENPCQHPVIIFRNVKFDDLNAIVNFMYHGEVNIFQEQLESFLITAELLEVKGLTDSIEEDISRNQTNSFDNNISLDLSSKSRLVESSDEPINLATIQPNRDEFISPTNTILTVPPRDNVTIETNTEITNTEEISAKRSKLSVANEEVHNDNQVANIEDLSEKNSNDSDIIKFRCQLCPKGFKHPTSLTLHKDSHAGKTQCPVCYRSFSRSYDMRSHLQRIHQGKQLTIKEIRYKATNDSVAPKQFTHQI